MMSCIDLSFSVRYCKYLNISYGWLLWISLCNVGVFIIILAFISGFLTENAVDSQARRLFEAASGYRSQAAKYNKSCDWS